MKKKKKKISENGSRNKIKFNKCFKTKAIIYLLSEFYNRQSRI